MGVAYGWRSDRASMGSTLFPGIDGVGRSLSEFAHYAAIDKSVLAAVKQSGSA